MTELIPEGMEQQSQQYEEPLPEGTPIEWPPILEGSPKVAHASKIKAEQDKEKKANRPPKV